MPHDSNSVISHIQATCRFNDTPGLIREVYASFVDCLDRRGFLRTTPFDDSICENTTLRDIDNSKVIEFVETAESKGRLSLKGSRSPKAILENFKLLRDRKPTNAAILLFGKEPNRFFHNAQVHCFHYFGTQKRKPIASQQQYEGRLFDVIDQSVEFVLGKLDRHVGTRGKSTRAAVEFEVPRSVIAEAVINAVIHRDYYNNGFVQVIVFADRIEVWNPGHLPTGMTPEMLRKPHPPIPRYPIIAEILFRVNYIEKAGTGTTDMIADCIDANLHEPDFEQKGSHFVVTIWRDWLTPVTIKTFNLNERQQRVITHLKTAERIGNTEYQTLLGVSKRTAHRDLRELVDKGVLEKMGTTGKGTAYILRKGATKGSKGSNK